MPSSEVTITNLLYRYAEAFDLGDFDGAAALFEHAQIKVGYALIPGLQLAAVWKANVIVYDDGTPRTKHLLTNPIVEVDEDAGRATCRSYFTVIQGAPGTALQPIVSGRFHDEFELAEGTWRFSYRDYTLFDLPGDMSRHAKAQAAD